jgi:hypothetical protein
MVQCCPKQQTRMHKARSAPRPKAASPDGAFG